MALPFLFDPARPQEGGIFSLAHLGLLLDQGLISLLDFYLAGAVGQAFPGADPLVLISCALVSNGLSRGHTCLDLRSMAGQDLCPESVSGPVLQLPQAAEWVGRLRASGLVGDEATPGPDWVRQHPLVLDQDLNLYLAKYYDFQANLIQQVVRRMNAGPQTPVAPDFIEAGLTASFGGQDPERTAGQRLAVKKALEGNFLIISGGPGTGKTHVTGMIRALLADWHRERGLPEPRVISMAPTGKAAARLAQGATIHSVLRPLPDRVGFMHGQDHPLNADLVIVDEASMIDMALMARLFAAVPVQTRLVLLGDKNQLSPVQAGAVFSDLCQVPDLGRARAFLSVNFRSEGKAGISLLSQAVMENDAKAVIRLLQANAHDDIRFEDTGNADLYQILAPYLREGFQDLAQARTPEKALDALDRFRVLCAHHQGPEGTLQVNHLCEKLLRSQGSGGITRPILKQIVMVTRNDYSRSLFNGDTGVVADEGDGPRAFFRQNGLLRRLGLAQLPFREPAFAVTIHKSQGSEFDTVLILIPDRLSPVVTRQLLYTGITRARSKVVIAGRLDLIARAMAVPFEQRSNLAACLARETGRIQVL